MPYIRIKRIKTKKGESYPYAYLVENKYKKKSRGARQKVLSYLGRVYELQKVKEKPGILEHPFEGDNFKAAMIELVKRELLNHGFVFWNEVYREGDIEIVFNPDGLTATRNGKQERLVLQMNDGFLCNETVNELIHFRGKGDDNEKGKQFAKALVKAGININQEMFVALAERFVLEPPENRELDPVINSKSR
ncbi:hypothetical protein HYU13_04850 [Candidatus Woesearchaeota archaeon]|nr:hypothetical protein [Candidatus Woesearchaeota archaeon]